MTLKVKTVDECWEDSKKLIGLPVAFPGEDPEAHQVHLTSIDSNAIVSFAYAIGDDNPLYTDPKYARKTRWGGLLAHPTILNHVRYTIWRGAIFHGLYPVSTLVAGFALEFNDIIRVGDRFKTSLVAKDVLEKKGRTGPLLFTYSHAGYWNQYNELVATGRGGNALIAKPETMESVSKGEGVRTSMIYERETYHYSKEEVDKIVEGILSEERRGTTPRYWEDVEVGDALPPIVKGPLTTADLMAYHSATSTTVASPGFEIAFRRAFEERQTRAIANPATGWPYEDKLYEHYDWNLCRGRGLPAPFDVGCFRSDATAHLLSNWMGDDGFIRRTDVQFRKPNYYGDVTWFNAEVVKTYRDQVGNEEYGAVDIRIMCTNQLGEVSCPGIATVYLPSKGEPVKLSVPHEDQYEEYENYLQMCDEARAQWKTNPTWPIN